MEQRHRDVLRDNWVFLMDNLTVDYVLPILFQSRILSEDLIEQIKSESTSKQRNYSFLTILQRRGSNAFSAFLKALAQTDQDHVYERLVPLSSPETSSVAIGEQSPTSTAEPTIASRRSPCHAAGEDDDLQPRTSLGNILRQPDESGSTATSTLEEDFYRTLALKRDEAERNYEQTPLFKHQSSKKIHSPFKSRSFEEPPSSPPASSYSPHRRSSVEHTIRNFRSPFDINVKKTESLSLDFSVRLGNGEIYPNFSKPKGLCMIINNREFDKTSSDLAYRKGSDRDAANLSCLFEQIG